MHFPTEKRNKQAHKRASTLSPLKGWLRTAEDKQPYRKIWVTSEETEMLLINETRERLLTELGTTEGKNMEALLCLVNDRHMTSHGIRGKYRQQ